MFTIFPRVILSRAALPLIKILLYFWPAFAIAESSTAPQSTLSPMRFEWSFENTAGNCHIHCRKWISASGRIGESTLQDFLAFAKEQNVQDATVVLNSPGGVVVQALELGREFRRRAITTAVGRTLRTGDNRTTISPSAVCNSMCVFVLLGGVKRFVPEAAHVSVHQIWPASKQDDANAAAYPARTMAQTQRMLGEVAQYLVDMGGDIELFRIATRVPPWENLHSLTKDELRRLRIHNSDDVGTLIPYSDATERPSLVTPVLDPEASPAQGWTLVAKEHRYALVRRHPLTVDGQEIGTFEISFMCGDAPMSYQIEYHEKRSARLASADRSRLNLVGISIQTHRAMIPVESSKLDGTTTQMLSAARGTVSTSFIAAMRARGNQTLIVTTATMENFRTSIRLGHVGLFENLSKMMASCSR